MLQVNLLGSFGISVDGRRIHLDLGPSGQKMAALLFTYQGRPHRRERIADLFWPDMERERSRAALNSALWRLRKIMSEEPECDGVKNLRSIGEDVILEPKPWLTVDTNTISTLARKVAGKETGEPVDLAAIRSAIDLYHAPFLDGEDGEFFIEERERIQTCFVKLSHYALVEARVERAYTEGIDICRKVLSFDPFREYFVRNLLGLLCLTEQRAEAMRYFEKWHKLLRSEIGVAPMPQTTDLIQRIGQCATSSDVEQIWQRLSVERHAE